jgi:hypothetical protein
MICINPIAPFGDLARTSPALSTVITARIQCTGTAKRREASSIRFANDPAGRALAGCPADALSACAAFTGTIANDNTITTVQAAVPKRRKHATVLAPVQGKAASRRPMRPPWTAAARGGFANFGRDGGMVQHPVEQRNGRSRKRDAHHHSSLVQTGNARPTTADAAIGPKYRPSSESLDCQFMRKSSSSPTTRQPCQTGSGCLARALHPCRSYRPRCCARFCKPFAPEAPARASTWECRLADSRSGQENSPMARVA